MKSQRAGHLSFFYGWVIVAIGFLTVFTCLGLGRFAFGMLIPSMKASLALSYDSVGFISSANFAGYLASVALAPYVIKKFKPRAAIAFSLLLIAVTMFFISRSDSASVIIPLYALTGVGTGFANVIIMLLISHWFLKSHRGKAAGMMVTGNGVAIISAGIVIPYVNGLFHVDGWRVIWIIMGCITLVVSIFAAVLLRNNPSDMGLEPHGHGVSAVGNPDKKTGTARLIVILGILYLIFGSTYVIYGTFIVSTMINDFHFTESSAGILWSLVGFFGLFSGVGFGMFSDKAGRKAGFAVVFAVQTAAYLLAGLSTGSAALYMSVFLYGIAAFSIPTIMAAAVADYFGASKAAVSFSIITFFFAAGQTGGPALAGVLAQQTGSFAQSYVLSGLLTAVGIFCTFLLPSNK